MCSNAFTITPATDRPSIPDRSLRKDLCKTSARPGRGRRRKTAATPPEVDG